MLDAENVRTTLPDNEINTEVIDIYYNFLNLNEDWKSKLSPLRFYVPSNV